MATIQQLTDYLHELAPPSYQEGYDNSGLLVGSPQREVTGVLLTLDCTEAVVQEAIERKCNLVVAHHPIVFKGLKKLNGSNYVERTVIKAIRNDIALYAIHTNLDHVLGGVNGMIAERLGLEDVRILAPKSDLLLKLTYFVPEADAARVLEAVFAAGAGQIGAYAECSFQSRGKGTFKPLEGADPAIGAVGARERVAEQRVEVLVDAYRQRAVLDALKIAHPYEEVAYYLQRLENEHQQVGAGAVGTLPEPLALPDFLQLVKGRLQASVVKYTPSDQSTIRRVAVCGGAGSFLLPQALRAQADAFISSDFKYHEFFDAENRIVVCDIGHYESEVFTKQRLYDYLSKKNHNFALHLSEVNTNPVAYYY